jgi:hypothetical protein
MAHFRGTIGRGHWTVGDNFFPKAAAAAIQAGLIQGLDCLPRHGEKSQRQRHGFL